MTTASTHALRLRALLVAAPLLLMDCVDPIRHYFPELDGLDADAPGDGLSDGLSDADRDPDEDSDGGLLDDSGDVPAEGRVSEGLVALYTFDEGGGSTVRDTAGRGSPLDLTLASTDAVSWLDGALRFDAPTIAVSPGPATAIVEACRSRNELTLEAWVLPATAEAEGPARIVTLSRDTSARNFTLGHGGSGGPAAIFVARVRAETTNANGLPQLATPADSARAALTHVVFTASSGAGTRLYLDGEARAQGTAPGSFDAWDSDFALALGNEFGGERPFRGALYLVAIYCRSLSGGEVRRNLEAGP